MYMPLPQQRSQDWYLVVHRQADMTHQQQSNVDATINQQYTVIVKDMLR